MSTRRKLLNLGSSLAGVLVRSSTLFLYLGFALVLPAVCAMAQGQKQVGYVVDLEGNWLIEGHARQRLSKGQTVPAGGVVRIENPTQYDYLVIAYHDRMLLSLRCRSEMARCRQAIKLRQNVAPESAIGRIWATAMSYFRREPGRYSVHIVRAGDGNLGEGILRSSAAGVDFSPVLGGMKKRTYYAHLYPRAGGVRRQVSLTREPFMLKWNSQISGPVVVPIPNLKPGLYELVIQERKGSAFKPTLVTAWVGVVSPERYQQSSSLFHEAVNSTTPWKKELGQDTVRSYLRAYLESMLSPH